MSAKRKRVLKGTVKDKSQDRRISRIERRFKPELKYNSKVSITVAFDATALVKMLNIVTPIEGNEVRMKGITMTGAVLATLASSLIDDYRIDIIMDKTPGKLLATALDIYGSATPSFRAQVLPAKRGRYKLLKTWRGHFNDVGTQSREINWIKKFNFKSVSEVDSSLTATTIIRNGLYFIYWTTASANQPTILVEAIMSFEDN